MDTLRSRLLQNRSSLAGCQNLWKSGCRTATKQSSCLLAFRDGDGSSRLTSVFVNNGVLRKNEFEKVQQNLHGKLGLHVMAVDATDRFLGKLAGVTDPEKKRKIIGNEFIAVFEEEAHRAEKKEGRVDWLVQGTLYPDVIESQSVR